MSGSRRSPPRRTNTAWLDHTVYTDQNEWFIYGRARYQSFPLYYYGIGRDAPSRCKA